MGAHGQRLCVQKRTDTDGRRFAASLFEPWRVHHKARSRWRPAGLCVKKEPEGLMRNRGISGRMFSAVIIAELLLIGFVSWIAAGVPGLRRDGAPPSVSIEFAPAHQPVAPVRAHAI